MPSACSPRTTRAPTWWCAPERWAPKPCARLAASLERAVAEVGLPASLTSSVTGNAILLSRSADGIASGQMQAVCLAAGSIFLLILAGLRSLPLAVIAMIPNVVPVLLFFGLLGAGHRAALAPDQPDRQRGARHRDRRHRALHRALPGGADGGPRPRGGLAAREPERRDGDRHHLRDAGGRLLDHRALRASPPCASSGCSRPGTMLLCLVTDLILLPALLMRWRV